MPHGSFGNPLGLAWWNQSGGLFADSLVVEYTQGDSARLSVDGLEVEGTFTDAAKLYINGLTAEACFHSSGPLTTGFHTGRYCFSPTVGPKVCIPNYSDSNLQFGNSGDFGTFRLDNTTDEYLTVPLGNEEGVFDFGSGDFTMETWVQIESSITATYQILMSTQANLTEDDTMLGFGLRRHASTADGKLGFWYNDSQWHHGDDHFSTSGIRGINGDQYNIWTHCAVTVKDNSLSFWINGQKDPGSDVDMQASPDGRAVSYWSGAYISGGVGLAAGETVGSQGASMPIAIGRTPKASSPGTFISTYNVNDTFVAGIRITTGIARYTTNFTISSEPTGFPTGSADEYYGNVSFLLNGNEL